MMKTHEELFEDGEIAFTRGDFKGAFAIFESLAFQGCPDGVCAVGRSYLHGHGVETNPAKAVEYLERAAAMRNSNAAFTLGSIYFSGRYGVPRDSDLGLKWYAIARDLGCPFPEEYYPKGAQIKPGGKIKES